MASLAAPRPPWLALQLQPPCQPTAADRRDCRAMCSSARHRSPQHLSRWPRSLPVSKRRRLSQPSDLCMRRCSITKWPSICCCTVGQPASPRQPRARQRRLVNSLQPSALQSAAACRRGGWSAAGRVQPRARCNSRRTDSQAPADAMMLLGDAVMLLSTEFVRRWAPTLPGLQSSQSRTALCCMGTALQ